LNINRDSLIRKEKQPLTRAEREKRLQQAGSSDKLHLVGEIIAPQSNLSNLNLSGTDLSGDNLISNAST
jgi:hypothetical protein